MKKRSQPPLLRFSKWQPRIIVPVILVFFIFCISCKKNNGETQAGLSCRIITAPRGFEYYTDKPAVAGEWRKYSELIEGYHFFANKNCTKSIKNGGEETSFTYEFDDAGKILKMTTIEPGNAVSSVQYEYSCN